MSKSEYTLFVRSGHDCCDKVRDVVHKLGLPVTEKFLDKEPNLVDRLTTETGKVEVPCFKEGERFIFGMEDIISELDRMHGHIEYSAESWTQKQHQ